MDADVRDLEQRFTQLERDLNHTKELLREARKTSYRSVWLQRAVGVVLVALVATGITIASAAGGPQVLTVKAPFRVVDGSGKPLMIVTSGGLNLIHDGNRFMSATSNGIGLVNGDKRLVGLLPTSNGGQVVVFGKGDQEAASLGYNEGSNPELLVDSNGSSARLGFHNDKLGLRFYKGSNESAAMGQTASGTGALDLYGSSGNLVTEVASSGAGKGYLEIDGAGGNPAVQLADRSQGGYLGIANHGGTARVEAGVLSDDVGVVRAFGPGGFNFIMGRH